jgi:hypothetical protein
MKYLALIGFEPKGFEIYVINEEEHDLEHIKTLTEDEVYDYAYETDEDGRPFEFFSDMIKFVKWTNNLPKGDTVDIIEFKIY